MDFVRTRAIPALIAASILHAGPAAADCAALQGVYRYDAVSSGERDATLGDLVIGRDRMKLMRVDRAGTAPDSLAPTQAITAPKVTQLARRAELIVTADANHMRFFDAGGKELVNASIDQPDPFKCEGARLVRVAERTSGVANEIRVERIEEVLEVNAKGELVHRESFTVIEGPGKAHKRENRFARIP